MDKLINYFDKHPELGLKAFYSNPTQYIKRMHDLNEFKYPVKYDDFFPYADGFNVKFKI